MNLDQIRAFYGRAVTREFWYYGGSIYTIVAGRHIGADWGRLGYFTDVPALCGGRVVASFTSPILGGVVVVATGLPGNYAHITYCHLHDGDMLRYGAVVTQGQRVGRLAKNGESHGTAWTGEHCHVVCSRNANGAYWKSPSNVASTYSDPAILVASILAAPLPESENDMGTIDNTEANYQTFAKFLQRALKYDARENGFGPDWKLGSTLWEKIARSTVTEAQVKLVADEVVKAIGQPTAQVDYAAIEAAAERGARKALSDLTLVPKP